MDTRIAIVAGEHCPILPDGRLREAVDRAEFSAPIPHSPLLHSWKMTAEEMEAGEIVLAAVAPFMVGVFTKRSAAQQSWTFATGTPIAFRGEKLLLAAAHVRQRETWRPTDGYGVPAATTRRLHTLVVTRRWQVSSKPTLGDVAAHR